MRLCRAFYNADDCPFRHFATSSQIFFFFVVFLMPQVAGCVRGAHGDPCTVGQHLEIMSEVLIWGIVPLKNALAKPWAMGKDANL